MSISLSTQSPAAARPGGVALRSVDGRPLPHWIVPSVAAALVVAAMPELHVRVFGVERIVDAMILSAQSAQGVHFGDRAREVLTGALLNRSPLWTAIFSALFFLVGTLLAGMAMNFLMLADSAAVTARDALTATAYSRLAEVGLRALLWGWVVWVRGVDWAAAGDWLHVAQVNAGRLVPEGASPVLATAMAQVDGFRLMSAAIAVLVIKTLRPDVGWVTSGIAALGWTAALALLRVAAAAFTGIPLV